MRATVVSILLCACGITDSGSGPEGVGDPCVPGEIPEGGFQSQEVYVESPSLECRTRVCVSNHYRGDLDPDPTFGDGIADVDEACGENCGWVGISDRIYCTAACDDDAACPDGFECCPLLPEAGSDHCVRAGTCQQ